MLGQGYFLGGFGSSRTGSGGEDVKLEDGNIIFSPTDPIYIDENDNVYFDEENKNSRMYIEDNKVYVEQVV
ncbi:hypothetical protein JOC34_000461 [Virgibacillus halotolerans]|uniref:hypothetical protein n=1 Tax=Virgibacillus halotolerans TaxID=1071053 RepID=UPI0019613780|nr:hypothetical protein [Virgibacillus halotolerans]MBM7598104.1 hypothetical protein [Virgibacillus halotolerans]